MSRRRPYRVSRPAAAARSMSFGSGAIEALYPEHIGFRWPCGCTLAAPARDCDVGEALFRLARAAREGRLDRYRVSA